MLPLFDAIKTLSKTLSERSRRRFGLTLSIPAYVWVPVIVSILFSSAIGFGAGLAAPLVLKKIPFQYLPVFLREGLAREYESFLNRGDIEFVSPRKEVIKEKVIVQKEKEYVPQTSQEDRVVRVVKAYSPSVVSIVISKDVPVYEQYLVDPFEEFRQFFGDEFFSPFQVPQLRQKGVEKREVGGGTGFIVSSDGLIVTNKHVVQDASAEYTVFTSSGEKYPAKVLARDPFKDLAIIKVNASNLPSIPLGDSDSLQPGQTVVAIGNALAEFQNTVSVGVVSGLHRRLPVNGGVIEDVIQTDAAINRGNSGGPLLNLRGEVIGINTAMIVGAQNIGFAIPINDAKKMIDDVETKGKIVYPFLGVRYVSVTPELKEKQKLPVDYGAWIIRGDAREDVAVIPGSPADKAGLQENDIILSVDGERVTTDNPLAKIIQRKRVGETITLTILRKGKEMTLQAILEELAS